jgi:uncharacterized protein involved in exopolysaccharide biosynthesis
VPEEITVFDLVMLLFRRRRLIIGITALGIVAGALVAFLTPPVYRAETSIIPSAALGTASDIGNLSDFRAAASQFGLNLGSGHSDPSVLFPEFLRARGLQARVLARTYATRDGRNVDLVSELKLRGRTPEVTAARAASYFRTTLGSSYDFKTGVTRISLTLGDPVLAANVLNAFVDEMDAFAQGLRSGRAGQKVRFISQRVEDTQKQLTDAETRLTDFRLRNRQIAGAPQLQLEEGRLLREVRLNEELFLTLKTQLEIARIEEFRALPDVIVMEKAEPPTYKSAPHRAKLLVMFTFVAGLLSLVAVFLVELVLSWIRKARSRMAQPSR